MISYSFSIFLSQLKIAYTRVVGNDTRPTRKAHVREKCLKRSTWKGPNSQGSSNLAAKETRDDDSISRSEHE